MKKIALLACLALAALAAACADMKGGAALKSGNYAEAARIFEARVAEDPMRAWPRRKLALAYVHLRRYGDAKATLEPVLAENPTDPEAVFAMGLAKAGAFGHAEGLDYIMDNYSPPFKPRQKKYVLREAEKLKKEPDLKTDALVARMEEALKKGVEAQRRADLESKKDN